MNPTVLAALAMAGGAVGAAAVSTWGTRKIQKIDARVKENADELAIKQFSMDYFERLERGVQRFLQENPLMADRVSEITRWLDEIGETDHHE